MKIAVPFENGQVFQHFGRAEAFRIYTAEDGKITSAETVSTDGAGHSALAGLLGSLKVDALICGGIGAGARSALDAKDIALYAGVSGDADEAALALAEGRLESKGDQIVCEGHHHHHEHGEGCTCGCHH